jgi:cellulase
MFSPPWNGRRLYLINWLNSYPPFNSKIDPYLGKVKRIEWGHDIVGSAFEPITNFSSPALTCKSTGNRIQRVLKAIGQPKPSTPALSATARAGAEVTFKWTGIVRMHQGPILTVCSFNARQMLLHRDSCYCSTWDIYRLRTRSLRMSSSSRLRRWPLTLPKVGIASSFRTVLTILDKWANEIAADNGNSYSVQIPSDIKAGTYVLRTELVALHGNMANLRDGPLYGAQVYPHCFNINVVGAGLATPEGVNIPGAYKSSDYGLAFQPYMTYKDEDTKIGTAQNSKYVSS